MFALLEGAAQVKCRDGVEITNDEKKFRFQKIDSALAQKCCWEKERI